MCVNMVGSMLCRDPAWSQEIAPFPEPQAGWQREEKVLVVLCLLQQREGFLCVVLPAQVLALFGELRKFPLPLALEELQGFACFHPLPSLGDEELPSSRAMSCPSQCSWQGRENLFLSFLFTDTIMPRHKEALQSP